MLSRVANSLYWFSRYLERAENTARLVDINLQLLLDQRTRDSNALDGYWRAIVQSAGDEPLFNSLHTQATAASVTEFLVFQPENKNSILGAIAQSRENARMVRDQIAVELWEELNRLYLFLHGPNSRSLLRRAAVEFFHEIKAASLHLQGLMEATIPHSEGWHFIQAGKYLERADKTSRIIDVRHTTFPQRGSGQATTHAAALEWAAVLRSCSAWDAYKAVYGGEVQPQYVAEFLLLSDEFPRSVRFCVEHLNTCLRAISGVSPGRFSNEAEKLAGRLVAELQFSTADEIFDTGLHQYIDVLQTKLNAVGEALFKTYIFQPFLAPDDAQLQQQEEQQQQSGAACHQR